MLILGCFTMAAVAVVPPAEPSFSRVQLSNEFWAEGAAFGDFNHDGQQDVVAGPYWWEGPALRKRHEYYSASMTFTLKGPGGGERMIPGFEGALGTKNTYSDNFFTFTDDFNGDLWTDILVIGFPAKETRWFENPRGGAGPWRQHLVLDGTENESPSFADITGDGKPDLICGHAHTLGFAGRDPADATKPWQFHAVSTADAKKYHGFTHGIGIGDLNGDGRADLIARYGWWEQPSSLAGDAPWAYHPMVLGKNPAQMLVYDVNGDGRADIVTSQDAHGYGLIWFENVVRAGLIAFEQHLIMNEGPGENSHGVAFSQLHALDLIDMDGDGLKDIVTGKRFWAHGPAKDPDPNGRAVLYWFKLVRGPDKMVDFVPHLIDADSGVGTQVTVGRFNRDKRPDVVVANKKGIFVFVQDSKNEPVKRTKGRK